MSAKDAEERPAERRTAREVLSDHLRKRKEHQLEADIALNYAEDVVLFTSSGILRGSAGVRESAQLLQEQLPEPAYSYSTLLVDGEIGFLEWTAHGERSRVRDGADSFVIRDGRIIAQTIHYTVEEIPGA
ncbi:MAG TPA: nuclear transport factor 2 family protein [Anaerolineaceae bacterium]|nr:nuclear transport factor 2 family protein [Anaerolineaceae bacterium]